MVKADGWAARPSPALRSLKLWVPTLRRRFQVTIKAADEFRCAGDLRWPRCSDISLEAFIDQNQTQQAETCEAAATPKMLSNVKSLRPLRQLNLKSKTRYRDQKQQIRDIDCDRCFFFFSFFLSEEPFKSLPLCSGREGRLLGVWK